MYKRVKFFKKSKFEKFLDLAWQEIKLDTKKMFDWLLFYPKPKDKFEKWGHTFEVICVYIVLQFAIKGLLAR